MHVCTIAACNYLSRIRVLADSFLEQHPDGTCTVLLVDAAADPDRWSAERFEVLTLDDIDIGARAVAHMAAIYDVAELSTAVKPALLRTLLHRGSGVITFLDPDMELCAPIDEVEELAKQHHIVLTPHNLEPIAQDDGLPDEPTIMRAGIYNLGFISVSTDASAFLDWWDDRLRWNCRFDLDEGLHVDQRWVDLAPAYFGVHAIRDPGYNVAYWNIDQRPIEWTGNGYEAGGAPLHFFHFSGFDPEEPYRLSKYQENRSRIDPDVDRGLARLCMHYARRLAESSYDEQPTPYGWAHTADRLRLDATMRRLHRERLVAAGPDGDRDIPDPFIAVGASAFLDWLNEPVPESAFPGLTRYLAALHADRPDFQRVFPDLHGDDGAAFCRYVADAGLVDARLVAVLSDESSAPDPAPTKVQPPSATQRALDAAARRPAIGSTGRPMSQQARRLVLRVLSNYEVQQQERLKDVTQALAESDDEVRHVLHELSERVDAGLRELTTRLDALEHAELATQINEVARAARLALLLGQEALAAGEPPTEPPPRD
jgi:hypothetical protein